MSRIARSTLSIYLVSLMWIFIAFTTPALAESALYSQSYGSPDNPSLIFLHGGPGYSSFMFEKTTASALAAQGYYVIVYDRQAEGHSPKQMLPISLDSAVEELNTIYKKYEINQAYLMGHSFGGTLGLRFAQQHPQKVSALIWVGSPLSYPHLFQRIHQQCEKAYTEQDNTQELAYLQQLRAMDPSSLSYSSYSFMHALQCGLYRPKHLSDAAKQRYQQVYTAERQLSYQPPQTAVQAFFETDHYTQLELTSQLLKIQAQRPLFGIYGEEDGLFDSASLQQLKALFGASRFYAVPGASHNVFVDQPEAFIKIMEKIRSENKR